MTTSSPAEDSDAAAHFASARQLHKAGRFGEALAQLDRAAALRPDEAAIENARGDALDQLQRLEEALAAYERAIALRAEYAFAYYNRANTLFRLERFEESLASYGRAAELNPNFAQVFHNRGVALRKVGRGNEALADFDRAIALAPTYSEAYFNRAISRLHKGDFAGGWRDYEHRWNADSFLKTSAGPESEPFRALFDPQGTADGLAGARVLLLREQGIGDVLMFASILPDLLGVARSVALLCDGRLRRLLSDSFPGVRMVGPEEAVGDLAQFGQVLPIGSLGGLFRKRAEDFPGRAYLSASEPARARWAERLGPRNGKARVGLSWRGGIAQTGQAERSLRLDQLQPILDLPNCEFVSLQYGLQEDEAKAINGASPRKIRLFDPAEMDDFDDLAGLIQNLDLVISVQTSVAHLAGALGAPTLVMIPANAEWRYGDSSPSMVWYNSVRLFRRDGGRGWAPVLSRVAAAAADYLGSRP